MKQIIPSVNFHLWEPCNMRCKFCFATFQDVKQTILPKGHLPQREAIKVVEALADFGFEKITFAGGEPTLCPWLTDLIKVAKEKGLTTMIVTNGTNLTEDFLQKNKQYLDWIAVSIDSLHTSTNIASGRAISGRKAYTKVEYLQILERVKSYGYRLKINTVVNRTNFQENMTDFILSAKPERWKVLQVLPVTGQNDKCFGEFGINSDDFQLFLDNHVKCQAIIPESNDAIRGSYAMTDPAGRFFHNVNGGHQYSSPILEVGAKRAFAEMPYSFRKFSDRGGIYDWE